MGTAQCSCTHNVLTCAFLSWNWQAFLDSLSEVLLCCNVLQTAAITAAQGEPAAEATGADHATSLLLTTAAATAEPAMPAAQQEEQAAGHGADGCIAAVHAAVAAEQSLVAGTACSLGSVDCEQRAQEAPAAAGTEQQLQKQPGGSSARTANCIDAVSVPAAAAACSAQPAATAATGLRHILLVSGTDVPVKLLPAGALPAGVTLYGSYDYPKDHVADLQEVMYEGMLEAGFGHIDARKWTSCLVPHHQWMCVSLEHALVLVSMRGVILKVSACHLNDTAADVHSAATARCRHPCHCLQDPSILVTPHCWTTFMQLMYKMGCHLTLLVLSSCRIGCFIVPHLIVCADAGCQCGPCCLARG